MVKRLERGAVAHRAVIHNGICFFAGMVADDRSLPISGQTQQIFTRLDRMLAEVGSSRQQVLFGQIYLVDIALRDTVNALWLDFFGEDLPARAAIGVNQLGTPETLIEVVFTAAVA